MCGFCAESETPRKIISNMFSGGPLPTHAYLVLVSTADEVLVEHVHDLPRLDEGRSFK